eukprot:m.269624 g.269624  ORF g.269624 m.269624 type:complete len:51 (-) comp79617_c0_seq1:2-154(-)
MFVYLGFLFCLYYVVLFVWFECVFCFVLVSSKVVFLLFLDIVMLLLDVTF